MITLKPFKAVTLAALIAASTLAVAHASTITGAGASFPYPVYAKWASDYKAATGNQVNYQSIGSGGGQLCAAAEAPADARTLKAGVVAGQDIDIGIAYVERGRRVGA